MDVPIWTLGLAAAVIAVAAAISVWSTSRVARSDEERRRIAGIDGTAVVIDVAEEQPPSGESVTEWFLRLEVTLADGERFEVRKYWRTLGARAPRVGDGVTVRAHPDRRRDVELVSVPFDA